MQHTQQNFLMAYDVFVHEIFSYFLAKTQERNTAKALTQKTFISAWNEVSQSNTDKELRTMHSVLKRHAARVATS